MRPHWRSCTANAGASKACSSVWSRCCTARSRVWAPEFDYKDFLVFVKQLPAGVESRKRFDPGTTFVRLPGTPCFLLISDQRFADFKTTNGHLCSMFAADPDERRAPRALFSIGVWANHPAHFHHRTRRAFLDAGQQPFLHHNSHHAATVSNPLPDIC